MHRKKKRAKNSCRFLWSISVANSWLTVVPWWYMKHSTILCMLESANWNAPIQPQLTLLALLWWCWMNIFLMPLTVEWKLKTVNNVKWVNLLTCIFPKMLIISWFFFWQNGINGVNKCKFCCLFINTCYQKKIDYYKSQLKVQCSMSSQIRQGTISCIWQTQKLLLTI